MRGSAALLATLLVLACGGGGDPPSGPNPDGGGQDTGATPSGAGDDGVDGGDQPDEPRIVTIEMSGIAYVAPTTTDVVTIKLGERIRWVNRDGTRHTATSDSVPPGGKGFGTGLLEPGGEYVFRPNVTGRWVYSCRQYPNRMSRATIRVVP